MTAFEAKTRRAVQLLTSRRWHFFTHSRWFADVHDYGTAGDIPGHGLGIFPDYERGTAQIFVFRHKGSPYAQTPFSRPLPPTHSPFEVDLGQGRSHIALANAIDRELDAMRGIEAISGLHTLK